jgi:hypothetical protein
MERALYILVLSEFARTFIKLADPLDELICRVLEYFHSINYETTGTTKMVKGERKTLNCFQNYSGQNINPLKAFIG